MSGPLDDGRWEEMAEQRAEAISDIWEIIGRLDARTARRPARPVRSGRSDAVVISLDEARRRRR